MGKVTQLLSYIKIATDQAMYKGSTRIEVSEAVHIHRRDVRTLMTPNQFEHFSVSVEKAKKRFNGQLSPSDVILDYSEIPDLELFDREWKIEEVKGGLIHFHYGDLRIEMTPKRFEMLAGLFQTALEIYNGK